MKKKLISFVVSCYNMEHAIGECIESILRQGENIEVIVVDDGSDDRSVDIISKYPVKIITQSRKGYGASRAAGLAYANGDYISFINGDMILSPNWLDAMFKTSWPKDIGAKLPNVSSYYKKGVFNIYEEFMLKKTLGDKSFITNSPYKIGMFNCIFKKEVIEKIGSFDSLFIDNAEDADFLYRMYKLGYKTMYVPEAICIHKHPLNFKSWIKRRYRYGSTILFHLKHRETFRLLKKVKLASLPLILILSYFFPLIPLFCFMGLFVYSYLRTQQLLHSFLFSIGLILFALGEWKHILSIKWIKLWN